MLTKYWPQIVILFGTVLQLPFLGSFMGAEEMS